MRAAFLSLTVALLATPPLLGQTVGLDRGDLELIALARPGFLLGVQGEFMGLGHVVPWLSARYGTHNANCLTSLVGPECGASGLSTLAGVRLRTGPWGPVEPYVTLGLGPLWYNEGEVDPRADDPDMTGTAHVGVVWVAFGSIRPRIEFGLESNVSPWVNVGVGLVP